MQTTLTRDFSGRPEGAERQAREDRGITDLSAAELRTLVAANPTFSGLDGNQLDALRRLITERRTIAAGEFLLREGDHADAMFIIETGRLEIVKKDDSSDQLHRLAILDPGMSVGELALLDEGTRSASVRALEPACVLVVPLRDLGWSTEASPPIGMHIQVALGRELARRLRTTNQATVDHLRRALREEQVRAEMGRFMCRLLIGTCFYMFALGLIAALKPYLPDTTAITVFIVIAFATSIGNGIRTSSFPASAFGLTTRNWQPAVKEALLFSIPVAGLMVLAKWLGIHILPGMAGQPLLDLSRSIPMSVPILVATNLVYIAFVPFQEMIARAIQSSLMLYLTSRFRIPLAILIAALLFSALHLYISAVVTLATFPLGLFWGWLYLRNPTLAGVSVSHALLGVFAINVVGLPG